MFSIIKVCEPLPRPTTSKTTDTLWQKNYIYYVYCTYREHGGSRSSILQNPSGSIYMSVCSFSNQFSKFIVPAHLPFQFIHNGLLFIESDLKVIVENTNLFCSSSFLETKLKQKANGMGSPVFVIVINKEKVYILYCACVVVDPLFESLHSFPTQDMAWFQIYPLLC